MVQETVFCTKKPGRTWHGSSGGIIFGKAHENIKLNQCNQLPQPTWWKLFQEPYIIVMEERQVMDQADIIHAIREDGWTKDFNGNH